MPHTPQDKASCSALHCPHGYSRWGEPCSCTRWRTELGAEAQSNAEDINLGFQVPRQTAWIQNVLGADQGSGQKGRKY